MKTIEISIIVFVVKDNALRLEVLFSSVIHRDVSLRRLDESFKAFN